MRKVSKIVFFLVLCFGITSNCLFSADFDSVKINIIVYADTIPDTQSPKTFTKLFFGFHKDATDGLDFSLGENDLPPLIPPGMLYAHFIIKDSIAGDDSVSEHYSYLDYKNFPPEGAYKEYFFQVFNNSINIGLKWDDLPACIERAILNDNLIGNIIEVDMKKEKGFFSKNPAFRSFKIKLWYNPETSVDEEKRIAEWIVYPNPCSDIINVFPPSGFNGENCYFRILSIMGELLKEGSLKRSQISIENLAQGAYILYVFNEKGNGFYKKILKVN